MTCVWYPARSVPGCALPVAFLNIRRHRCCAALFWRPSTFGLLALAAPITAQTLQSDTPAASSTDSTTNQGSMEEPQTGEHWRLRNSESDHQRTQGDDHQHCDGCLAQGGRNEACLSRQAKFRVPDFRSPLRLHLKMVIGDLHRMMAWHSGAACGWQDVVDPSHRRQQGWRL